MRRCFKNFLDQLKSDIKEAVDYYRPRSDFSVVTLQIKDSSIAAEFSEF